MFKLLTESWKESEVVDYWIDPLREECRQWERLPSGAVHFEL